MKISNCFRTNSHSFFLFLCIFCCSLCFHSVFAQARFKDTHISDEQMDRLRQKTVVLVLPSSQYDYLDDYKSMVPKAWTLTPIVVAKFSDVAEYMDPEKYAVFGISAVTSSGSYTNTHYWLTLSVPYQKEGRKKASTEYDELCRIDLYPDRKTQDIGASQKHYNELYEGSVMRNFTLPYIMTYLRYIQLNLKNQTIPGVYAETKDDALLSKLEKDTLYVPDSLVYHRSGFSSKEDMNEKDLFATYSGKYRIVSTQELTELIKNRTDKKPLFIFEYVLSSTDKFVSIYNETTGALVYRNYKAMTYNLKPKDIEAILK